MCLQNSFYPLRVILLLFCNTFAIYLAHTLIDYFETLFECIRAFNFCRNREKLSYNQFSKFPYAIFCHIYRLNRLLEQAENWLPARLNIWRSAFWWLEKNQPRDNRDILGNHTIHFCILKNQELSPLSDRPQKELSPKILQWWISQHRELFPKENEELNQPSLNFIKELL